MSNTAEKTRKLSPKQLTNELLQQRILDIFGPPSRGVQKTRLELQTVLDVKGAGPMIHALWRLEEKGKLQVVGTRKEEGARGRGAKLYARS